MGMVFVLVSFLAVFVVIFILPVITLFKIGKEFGGKYKKYHIEKLLPILGFITICSTVWLLTYNEWLSTYEKLCEEVPYVKYYSSVEKKPSGFLIENLTFKPFYVEFNAQYLLKQRIFSFYEELSFNKKKFKRYSYEQPITSDWLPIEQLKSTSFITSYPLAKYKKNSFAPIYTHTIKITDITTNRVIAEAKELIFGGGKTGLYMSLLKGSSDYKYYSCGFVSDKTGSWRPTLSSSARAKAYEQADEKFIIKALTPPE